MSRKIESLDADKFDTYVKQTEGFYLYVMEEKVFKKSSTHVTFGNGWFPAIPTRVKTSVGFTIEFVRSKLLNFSAHVSEVADSSQPTGPAKTQHLRESRVSLTSNQGGIRR